MTVELFGDYSYVHIMVFISHDTECLCTNGSDAPLQPIFKGPFIKALQIQYK